MPAPPRRPADRQWFADNHMMDVAKYQDDFLPPIPYQQAMADAKAMAKTHASSPPQLPPRLTVATDIDNLWAVPHNHIPQDLLFEMATQENLYRLQKVMVQAMTQGHNVTASTTFTNDTFSRTTRALTNLWINNSSTSATNSLTIKNLYYDDSYSDFPRKDKLLEYAKDFTGEVKLPDGAKLIFDNGNYRIEDQDAKITYKANRNREFNKYLNASDLLEEFIGYLGSLKLTKEEVLQVPIETFIMWLIISAAEADQEDKPSQEILMLESKVDELKTIRKPRCKCCGQFIHHSRKRAGIEFCSGVHMDKWFAKAA
jgi:hypothetical protein